MHQKDSGFSMFDRVDFQLEVYKKRELYHKIVPATSDDIWWLVHRNVVLRHELPTSVLFSRNMRLYNVF